MVELKDLAGIAVLFLTIAIILGISTDVLTNFEDKYDKFTVTYSNESHGANITAASDNITLALRCGRLNAIESVVNSSNYAGTLNTDYYIIEKSNSSIIVTNISTNWLPVTQAYVNVTYDCNVDSGDVRWNASRYGNQSLEELGSWLPTIAIVIIAAVVIGIIALYFATR